MPKVRNTAIAPEISTQPLGISPGALARRVFRKRLYEWCPALAYWGRKLGTPVFAVLPLSVPKRTHQVCKDLGATILVYGTDLMEARRKACAIRANTKLTYINGYDHPHAIAAAGTIGIEILEQLPETQAILVPIGGGSLLAGIAAAVKNINPEVLVYGIESNKCPSFTKALEKNTPCVTTLELNIATSLNVPIAGCNALHTANGVVDDVVRIQDDWIIKAMSHLIDKEKIIVEGAAAITLAALMALPKSLKGLQEKR
ncbi:L-threonine ammonia-lyase-like [Battus philenor]|uniref:L-threonine ammonia-lyase-like n=1 Tax=Battus philenor TaxID=42288 RepID=UPI0035D0BEE1